MYKVTDKQIELLKNRIVDAKCNKVTVSMFGETLEALLEDLQIAKQEALDWEERYDDLYDDLIHYRSERDYYRDISERD